MRPPYGNTSPEALEWLGAHGYKVMNWNVDTNDWQHPESLSSSNLGSGSARKVVH
jgi:peptidoglycan/xylan/chitin deacetylase (PgdA/CDA1 family)